MADFNPAFSKTMNNEGGYALTNVPGDNGGQTYAGISRVANSGWSGWAYVDRGETPPTQLVRDFYKANYWDRFQGDQVNSQAVAENIYDFAVNAGTAVAIKLAQTVVKVEADGVVGPTTLAALNAPDIDDAFGAFYAVAKLSRYAEICNRNRSQSKFLLGWVNRILKGLK